MSADNLDFMHSFARVFCGNQRSSWHGTTVQVAQPLPSLSLPESYEGAVRPFVMSQGYPTHRDCTSMITQGTDLHISLTGAPCGGHGEAVHSNIHVNLDEEDADEFAEFVFAAAFDVGNETNVNAELIEE